MRRYLFLSKEVTFLETIIWYYKRVIHIKVQEKIDAPLSLKYQIVETQTEENDLNNKLIGNNKKCPHDG